MNYWQKKYKHRKIHFCGHRYAKDDLTFCGTHHYTDVINTSDDWNKVTCGNCRQRRYSIVETHHNNRKEHLLEIPS